MLKDFLEKCKIEKNLAEKLNNKEKTLYVIKGFGDYNFKSYGLKRLINVDLKLLNSVEEFDDKSFLTEIPLKFMEGKACVTSYEEFILFSNEIITLANIYDYKIEIFENDIFHVFYPLPSFVMEEQLVKNIESNKELNLSRIYDDYIYSSNGILISYQPFEKYETIISKSIFKACDLKIKEITEIKQVDPLIISLSDDDENFSIALMEIINHPKEKVYINFNKLNEPIYQLRTISILNSFGYKIFKIEKKIKKDDDVDYSEYEKILKRKNSNFSFRDIDFYKNPGFSLDTIKISQGNIVHALVQNAKIAKKEGKGYNDIFVTAPTGAGKSILFQIPAIYLAETEGLLTIVITPLIGLMNDQVQNIKSMTDKAATINSEYTPDEKNEIKKKIQKGEISILYVSPETLLSNNPIDNLIGNRKIGLLIIDEAHIVTTWGKSFRPDYWFLGDYISYLRNKQNQKFPIATFSATITYGGNDDMHGDVIDGLKMQTGQYEYIAPMRRDDIEFDIELHENVSDYLMEKEHAVLNSLNELNKNNIKTISYFPFTKQVNEYEKKMKSKKVRRYHGGLVKEEKDTALSNFRDSKNTMILATKAFGMGIDIDDIEVVYHYAPTGNLCDYVQEIGRAARKEDIVGTAKVDFFENDFRYINQLFGMSAIKNYQLIETLKKIRNIYLVKGQRNFTVSPDEFAYIFERKSNMDNIDSAFKTAMLMIQKDFERMPTVNFKPLIFKPRTLFTRAYVMIKPEVLKEMKKSPYRKYFKLYSSAQDMASKFTTKQSSYFYNANNHTIKQFNSCVKNTVTYLGDIYIVKLKELWEENFSDYSFAHFKYSFYQGELNYLGFAKDLLPEYLLTVNTSRHDFEKMISDFERIMDEIDNKLSITDITKSQLNLDDIAYIFESLESCELNHFESMIAANNFIEVINNYKANEQFNNNVVFKYNAATQRYIVQSVNLLRRRINYIINDCREKFQNVLQSNIKVFLIGSSSQGNDVGNSIQMKIALLLETFGLATYKVVSGERPEYFIRVNSVTAIEKIIDNQFYQSEMVQLVKFRHSESIRIMKKFFMELKTDKERWDYIEKYFSGMLKENE